MTNPEQKLLITNSVMGALPRLIPESIYPVGGETDYNMIHSGKEGKIFDRSSRRKDYLPGMNQKSAVNPRNGMMPRASWLHPGSFLMTGR